MLNVLKLQQTKDLKEKILKSKRQVNYIFAEEIIPSLELITTANHLEKIIASVSFTTSHIIIKYFKCCECDAEIELQIRSCLQGA